MSDELVRLDAADLALSKASTLSEVLQVRAAIDAALTLVKDARLDLEQQNHWAERRLLAERKAGGILADMDKATGTAGQLTGRDSSGGSIVEPPENSAPTYAELGIAKTQAARWQQMARIPEDVFYSYIENTILNGEELTTAGVLRLVGNGAHVSHNAGNNEWYTPAEYIEAARDVMGAIDLDPASSEVANAIVGAAKFYTADDNGLLYDWRGKVFMNPPYAQPAIADFCAKMREEFIAERVTEAIVLVNNATETAWFQSLISAATAVCFPLARIRFWSPDRTSAQPLQGQAVVYLGANFDAFIARFMAFGWCAEVA